MKWIGKHVWDFISLFRNNIVIEGANKIYLHDDEGGENITASSDGHLEINAGTTLDVTAPTIDMNASTLYKVTGSTVINTATGVAPGGGFSDADTAPEIHVSDTNGIIETLVYFDIDGLKSGGTQHDVIGDNGEADCWVTQITNTINGYIVHVELFGIEQTTHPSGSNPREIDIWANTGRLTQDATANTGAKFHLINSAGDHSPYGRKNGTLNPIGADLHGYYIYITNGHSSPGTADVYTAGKYMLRFTGIKTTY